jgi:hypothetical protein
LDRDEIGALLVATGPGTAAEHALISLLAINGLRISEALAADIDARPRLGSYAGSVKVAAADEHAVHRLRSPLVALIGLSSAALRNAPTSPTIVKDAVRAAPSAGGMLRGRHPECEPLSAAA